MSAGARLPADFWRLWSASTVSNLGDGVRMSALPLLAAGLTHDPRAVSLVVAAEGLPWLLFALPAGAMVDRWDRKRVLFAVNLARAAVLALLTAAVAADAVSIPLLLAMAFAVGSAETFADSAAQAALPAVVPAAQLERANGRLYAGMVVAGAFAGPPIGSALFVLAAAWPFGADAAICALAAVLLFGMRANLTVPAEERSRGRLLGQIGEGLRWLWRHQQLRVICLLLTLWNLVETALFAIVVLWALEVLRLPEASYGVLLTGLAVGGVAGSLLAERLSRKIGPARGMAASIAGTAVGYAGMGLTRHGVVAFFLLLLVGCAAFAWNVLSASFRQAVVPTRLQGRVNSAYRFATWGIVPVGAALGGLTADRFGLQAPFLGAAVLLGVAGIVAMPRLRTADLTRARSEAAAASASPEGAIP
jgi:predicted MFS family arabinose efflux permease